MANLERADQDGVTVLRFRGSLTQDELSNVQQSFHDATHCSGAAVVVDLTNVDLLTTPAIAMFLDGAKSLRGTGGRVVVAGPQPRIDEVLRRLRLDVLLPVCPTVAAGIEQVRKSCDGAGDKPS